MRDTTAVTGVGANRRDAPGLLVAGAAGISDPDGDRPGGPKPGWRPAEWLAVPAGWALATFAIGPVVLSAGADARWSMGLTLAATLAWWVAVVATIRSDLSDFIIPDEASLATAALGLAAAAGGPLLSGDGVADAARAGFAALASGAVAFALFWLVGAAFRHLGRHALGFGDVKLAGACAVWLTPGDAALALEVAALGAMGMLLFRRRGGTLRDTAVPFGAFLAPAAWLVFVLVPVLAPALHGDAGLWP